MLIALLVVLGVDFIVIVIVLLAVLTRRHWVSRQPGVFRGAIRITEGKVPGLGARWRRGYGRWVGEVLVWTKGPLLFWNELVPAEGRVGDARAARPGEVKRLGKHPEIVAIEAQGGSRLAISMRENPERALGPFAAAAPDAGRSK
jgi:hypothetical protein